MQDKLDVSASIGGEEARIDALERGKKIVKERNKPYYVSWKVRLRLGGCQLCSGALSSRLRWWEAHQASRGGKKEAFESSGTTNLPFSAVVHLDPQFLQRETYSYSLSRGKNWIQAKTKGAFVEEDSGVSRKSSALQSPQPQREKYNDII